MGLVVLYLEHSKTTMTSKISFAISAEIRYFKHRKYQNLRMNNKVRGDLSAICLRFLPHLQKKIEFLISHGSVAK